MDTISVFELRKATWAETSFCKGGMKIICIYLFFSQFIRRTMHSVLLLASCMPYEFSALPCSYCTLNLGKIGSCQLALSAYHICSFVDQNVGTIYHTGMSGWLVKPSQSLTSEPTQSWWEDTWMMMLLVVVVVAVVVIMNSGVIKQTLLAPLMSTAGLSPIM